MTKTPAFSFKILLYVPFFPLITLSTLVFSQTPPSELAILLNIKKQWKNQPPLQSWDPTTSPCHWPGIQCNNLETVTEISLNTQNIHGKIPPSICELNNLTILDLGNNYIFGDFPTFLYNCSNLQSLDLSLNSLDGHLPNDINNLSSKLEILDLNSNNFCGDIPSSIGQLKGLLSLNLAGNFLNGTFPLELGNLENLKELLLAYNPFSQMNLPIKFGMLKSLKFLWMTQCNLIGTIPQGLANLSNLEHLDLANNNLVGHIPSRLFMLKNLTYLYLYDNELTGWLPRLMQASNVKEIDVANNKLTGTIPHGIRNSQSLEVLNLYQNHFLGIVPPSIGLIPTLKTLKLFSNNFSGSLPPELGLHSKLEYFEVADNGFIGQLPQNLCFGKTLLGLVAHNNFLRGTLPSSLSQCNSLLTIMLYNNSLSGEVPQGVWTLKSISSILLYDNQFIGQFPKKLGQSLTCLKISNNKFSGSMPPIVGTWKNLHKLHASNNLLSGNIPLEITSLTHLSSLLLDGNKLSSELPSKIISWKNLTILNLSRNELYGTIPSGLGYLPVLTYLDLSNNQLSGLIPSSLGQLKLSSFNLSSNKLTGRIPYEFENCAYETSFMNTNVCSSVGIINLPKCSIHHTFSKYFTFTLAFILVLFIVIFSFSWFMIRKFKQRIASQDKSSWKLISFHRIDFTIENILAKLTRENLIGSGGCGEVFRMPINHCSEEFVAIKKIKSKKIHNMHEKQFLAEVEILGKIRHVNIVKLLCCITSEETKLLVYEFMENQSLDKWIHVRKRRHDRHEILGWPQRLKIALEVAKGLCYMHHGCSPSIIHRDIKSSNILLDLEFNAKIADFGLSKILVKQGQPQTVSTVAGSFGYMASEYCYTSKADVKIDIYSFGVILLELVTGKEPHRGDEYSNLAEWAWKHYSQRHPIIQAFDEDVKQDCYLDEMMGVFKLGLMCTSSVPSSRPSMKGVQLVLEKYTNLPNLEKFNESCERDFDPLIGRQNYVSSCKNSGRAIDEDDYSRDWVCNHSL